MGPFKNVRVVIDLLLARKVLTLLLAPFVVLEVVFAYQQYSLSAGEIVIALVGAIAAFAFLKASCLFVFYGVAYRSKFEGSPFVVAALICMLLLIALSAMAYLGSSRADDISNSDLLFILVGSYAAFTIIIWLGARTMHWLFQRA
jgi:hypothetical protein